MAMGAGSSQAFRPCSPLAAISKPIKLQSLKKIFSEEGIALLPG